MSTPVWPSPLFLRPAFAGPPSGDTNPLLQFVPILLVLLIFYALILRPQQRKQKEHQAMLGNLNKGDRVLTNGGLYATVLNVKDDMIVASINADGTKVEIAKNAVAHRVKAKK